MIQIRDVLSLDDKHAYVVISKINHDQRNYYYLFDQDDYSNVKFCYEDQDELVLVNDQQLIMKLMPLFLEATRKEFDFESVKF